MTHHDYRALRCASSEDTQAIAENQATNRLLAIGNAILTTAIVAFFAALIYALL